MKPEKQRLQKYLAGCGVCSRRKAEELILAGKVKVNGQIAQLGDSILPGKDMVLLSGKRVALASDKIYIMLNKPRGYITTLSDEHERKCVAELVKDIPGRIFPVGRLDKDSEGLLLMTNDGEFANFLTHPSHQIAKTYRVTIKHKITDEQQAALIAGIKLDGRKTAPASVYILEEKADRVILEMVISEGRNRQIRRMCQELNLEVLRLKRTAVGPLKLGMLAPGKWRSLTPQELKGLRG